MVWVPNARQILRRVAILCASEARILINTQSRHPWRGDLAWDDASPGGGRINRFGVGLQDGSTVMRVALRKGVSTVDMARLAWRDFWSVEPVGISSINLRYGPNLLGNSLTVLIGAVVVFLALVTSLKPGRRQLTVFFWVSFAGFALFDVTLNHSLWDQAKKSSKVSALYADRYEEYSSRFGQEFAELDRLLKQHVPEGTAVGFPDPKPLPIIGENNWLWFLYHGEYDNVRDRGRNSAHIDRSTQYVMYYHPRLLKHYATEGSVKNLMTQAVNNVAVVAEVSKNAKILKVLHD